MALPLDNAAWQQLDRALLDMARPGRGRLVYVPNVGNAGDALIATAAWQRFDRLGLRPMVVRRSQLQPGDRAIYAGGGNLVPEYRDCELFLHRCLKVGVSAAIVLPHSIRGHAELLRSLDARFTLVCREQPGLRYVTEVAQTCHCFFAPDLALGIDVAKLFATCRGRPALGAGFARIPRQLLKYWSWKRRIRRVLPDSTGRLTVFRCDAERMPGLSGNPEYDLSNHYGSPFRMRGEADQVSFDFLQVIDRARIVETNRLHVGIGAALLGKEVILHDNSYGKLGAVFEASLQGTENLRLVSKKTSGAAQQTWPQISATGGPCPGPLSKP